MKKSLITSVAALAVGLFAFAETNMVTKLKNGQLIRYDVEEIEEVFFEDYVEESETPLKFTILTDSTAAVAEDLAYVSLTGVVTIPSNVKIDGKMYNVVGINDSTFSGCKNITGIMLPSSIAKIGEFAFADCENLTHIEIPEGVTHINESAFDYCTSLTSVKLPSTITSIGYAAFRACKSLSSIELPSSVLNIGVYAFKDCTNLDITIDNSESNVTVQLDAFKECKSVTWKK